MFPLKKDPVDYLLHDKMVNKEQYWQEIAKNLEWLGGLPKLCNDI